MSAYVGGLEMSHPAAAAARAIVEGVETQINNLPTVPGERELILRAVAGELAKKVLAK